MSEMTRKDVVQMVFQREMARKAKEYPTADSIREHLLKAGVQLMDREKCWTRVLPGHESSTETGTYEDALPPNFYSVAAPPATTSAVFSDPHPLIEASLTDPKFLPPPSQQSQLIFSYPVECSKDNLRAVIVDILKTSDIEHTLDSYGENHEKLLSSLHLQRGCRSGRRNQKTSPFHKAFKTIVHQSGSATHRSLTQRFQHQLKHFVRTVVAPLLSVGPDDVLYQEKPNFRISHPSDVPMGRIHNDYLSNNHQPAEINFWIPFVRVFRENTLWIESAPGVGDFAPVEMEYGEAVQFWGNQVRHHTVANTSECTRVSIDFRAIARHRFNPNFMDSRGILLQRQVGEFYKDSGK